eukprot:TRINITY_DN79730_c0_g1_i1.p1 TRINITY_DN79730_c0_g1~~TRINITY_DN79730_c0_g1_i1.p1  ORF type:complete len:431 (+),score=66.83 TRINITY_DN79730_c0_g1_i1:79-1371(+)
MSKPGHLPDSPFSPQRSVYDKVVHPFATSAETEILNEKGQGGAPKNKELSLLWSRLTEKDAECSKKERELAQAQSEWETERQLLKKEILTLQTEAQAQASRAKKAESECKILRREIAVHLGLDSPRNLSPRSIAKRTKQKEDVRKPSGSRKHSSSSSVSPPPPTKDPPPLSPSEEVTYDPVEEKPIGAYDPLDEKSIVTSRPSSGHTAEGLSPPFKDPPPRPLSEAADEVVKFVPPTVQETSDGDEDIMPKPRDAVEEEENASSAVSSEADSEVKDTLCRTPRQRPQSRYKQSLAYRRKLRIDRFRTILARQYLRSRQKRLKNDQQELDEWYCELQAWWQKEAEADADENFPGDATGGSTSHRSERAPSAASEAPGSSLDGVAHLALQDCSKESRLKAKGDKQKKASRWPKLGPIRLKAPSLGNLRPNSR